MADSQALRSIPLFAGLNDAQLEAIKKRLHERIFPKETNIISVETPGEVVYIILSGTVKIKVDQADGTEVIIALLGTGDTVGELSVIDSVPRSADVLTQERSTLLWMSRSDFREMLTEVPQAMFNLLGILARRLRLSTEQIQALCTLDVRGKVARQILVFADMHGVKTAQGVRIPVRLTQSDIANLVGVTRESVNAEFVDFRKRKYITVDNAFHITVLNEAKLREIVQVR